MTRVYYKDASACVIMFDVTQRSSFQNALKWKKDLDSKCLLPDGSKVPCILLANKSDLPHREVEQSDIESFCREHEFIGWTETSVKDGLMIEESMRFLIEAILNKIEAHESAQRAQDENEKDVVRLESIRGSDERKLCPC